MPEVTVRRRAGRRSGDWKYRLNRWFYRRRPQIAVAVAFLIACLLGLVAASGLKTFNLGPASPSGQDSAAP